MATAPFGAALEAALKETTQGGKLELLTGLVYDPKFYCCISGTTVGLNKDPVPVLVVAPVQVCLGDVTNADYSRSWSGTDTLAANPWSIDWGDGNVSNGNFPGPRNPAIENVDHPLGGYAAIGIYDITLTVTDTLGATGSVMVQVEVINCLPVPAPGIAPVYAGCGLSGVWLSLDLGQIWTQIGDGSLVNAEVRDMKPMLATIANEAIHIWVASECGMFFSLTSGDTWWHVDLPSAESTTPDFADPYALACEKLGSQSVYVLAMDGYMGGNRPLIYRSTDRGLSWTFTGIDVTKWDGGATYLNWVDMDDGTIANPITQYASYSGGQLLAVGEWLFGALTRYLASWDGTNWNAVAITGLPVVGQIYYAAINSNDILYILGEWDFGAGLEAAVYYWSTGGGTWVQVGVQVAIGTGTYGIFISPGNTVYACVADNVYRVQNPGWAIIAILANAAIGVPHGEDIVWDTQSRMYIVGRFQTVNAIIGVNNAFRYDGAVHGLGGGPRACESAAIDPRTDYLYILHAAADPDRTWQYWNGSSWTDITGHSHNLVWPTTMHYHDGSLYSTGQGAVGNRHGYVYRYLINEARLARVVTTNPLLASRVYDIHWPADSVWMYLCGDCATPFNNAGYTNGYNNGLTIYPTGRTSAIDVSSDGRYLYLILNTNVSSAPIVIRLEEDLSDYIAIQELSGDWGGVQCDNTLPARVWLFGNFTPFDKIRISEDWGDTIVTRDDVSWNGNEVVRPLLINPFNPNYIAAILNFANEVWVSMDTGISWSQVGTTNTPFDAQCGAIDPYNDLILMIGRDAIGVNHLQMTADLGYNWQERSTGITAQAPITAIFMVK